MKLRFLLLSIFLLSFVSAYSMLWYDGKNQVSYFLPKGCDPVLTVAAEMFASDMEAVTGSIACQVDIDKALIRLYQIDVSTDSEIKEAISAGIDIERLQKLIDGFAIRVADGVIHIAGSNGRGAAYGLLELSRMAGVSPWIWWGDVVPAKKESLSIEDDFSDIKGASVERRGIFINDEDWSLRPWSHLTFEHSESAAIGAATYRKIFELLLRLRANTLWPAKKEGTTPFFLVEGAKQQADSCGIIIGTSSSEPMLRNNVGEWDISERGPFNYKTNREAVLRYWKERLQEVKDSKGGSIYTIGIPDSLLGEYNTLEEKFEGLQQVIKDQQTLISDNIGDPANQDQTFVPYKEMLDLYEMGLDVPEYVTLMWCDDNYGYLTRLSNEAEQKRSGGGGVYFHLSYCGQPHDYLWLTTTQPGLIWHQMRTAYDKNARKLWIANVHDPKVAGYNLELFLDMAWNIDSVEASSLRSHYKDWLTRQFGEKAAELIFPVMHDFYRLCGERRPEFMGWSQVVTADNFYERQLIPVHSTELNSNEFGNELLRYVSEFDRASYVVDYATRLVDPSLYDAYFATVIYPVCASAAHARSILKAQEARQLASRRNGAYDSEDLEEKIRQSCAESQRAYQEVRKLTEYYNDVVSDGKWKWSMDMRPHDLPVFFAPSLPIMLTEVEMQRYLDSENLNPLSPEPGRVVVANADSFTRVKGNATSVGMLGHSMSAVSLDKGSTLIYEFDISEGGDGVIKVAAIPTHAIDGKDVRFSVSVDGMKAEIFSLKEPSRSDNWKENVMRGQTIRDLHVSLKPGKHKLEIKAIDDNIVIDQWMWDTDPDRQFYLFPI